MILRHDLMTRRLLTESWPGVIIGGGVLCESARLLSLRKPSTIAVVHACKYPCFMRAGGTSPEWTLLQGNHLYLNLVDADTVEHIDGPAIELALGFLAGHTREGRTVVIHCNQGRSRAPSIALLHLARLGHLSRDYVTARESFTKGYPAYAPGNGMAEWVRTNWGRLVEGVSGGGALGVAGVFDSGARSV